MGGHFVDHDAVERPGQDGGLRHDGCADRAPVIDSVPLQYVPMHQVPGYVAGEDITPILFGKDIAVINRTPGRRSEISAGRQQTLLAPALILRVLFVKTFLPGTAAFSAPCLRLRQGKHLRRGAAVVGLDVNPSVCPMLGDRADFLGLECDVTSAEAVEAALDAAARAFGGLDMLVLNAGIFPSSRRIEALPIDEWRRVMQVNLDANLLLLSACHGLLKCAPRAGRVVVIGSKNVPAPGPGAAAYSASKAALNQLARVAALEWGVDGIRVNVLHPNAVFDTGIWTENILRSRAESYGLSVEEYRKNNVLRVEVTSRDVAELAAEMCGPLFAKTTGAQVPVDGGNERVI